ncbi:alcohol dehydrogenase catalytic domain-containing protein [Lysinibacillus fusiformis]
MKAAKFYGMKDIRVEEAELPVLENGMVKVKIGFAGICGSDLHEYVGGAYAFRTQPVLGHEFSGVVVEVAEGVTHTKVGDRVAVEPPIPCGKCANCKRGYSNLCKSGTSHMVIRFQVVLLNMLLFVRKIFIIFLKV